MSALWHYLSDELGLVNILERRHIPLNPSKYRAGLIAKSEEFRDALIAIQSATFLINETQFLQYGDDKEKNVLLQSALGGLEMLHAVGITERLADSLRILAWYMRWPAPRNIATARVSEAGQQHMPSEVKANLERHLYFDGILYDRAKERFLSDYNALCKQAGSAEKIDDFLDERAKLRTYSA